MKHNKTNEGVVGGANLGRRSVWWIAAGACAVVVLCLLAFFAGRSTKMAEKPAPALKAGAQTPVQGQVSRPAPRPARAPREQTPAARSSLGFRPGDHLVYDFTQSLKVVLMDRAGEDSAGTAAPPPAVGVDLAQEGQLILDVYSALSSNAPEGWLVGFRLSGATIEMKMEQIAIDHTRAALEKELTESRVLAEVRESGRIEKIAFFSLASAEAKTMWKDILARWQVILPEKANADSWEYTENDVTGTYIANYTRPSLGYPQQVTKRKPRYVSISAQAQGGVLNAKCSVEGETAIELNPYQAAIKGEESVSISGPGNVSVETDAAYSFHLRSAEYSRPVETSGPQMLAEMGAATNVLSWAAENAVASAPVPEMTPEEVAEIMDRLKELLGSGQAHSGEHVEVAGEMIDAIRASQSSAVSTIMDAFANDMPEGEYAATLTGVLGGAGTPAAQEALLKIITAPDWPPELRAMALQSLVQVTNPIAAVDNVLMTLLNDGQEYADSAFMILAAMGQRLRESDPARRENISRFILEQVREVSATDQAQMTFALAAIANLGPAEVPNIVTTAVNSDNADIREQAILSLQRIHTDESDKLIGRAVADSNELVRTAAVRMLGEPDRKGGLDILHKMVSNDPSDSVRTAAIMGLAQWNREGDDTVVNILREVSKKDPSEEVRRTAMSQIDFLLLHLTYPQQIGQ